MDSAEDKRVVPTWTDKDCPNSGRDHAAVLRAFLVERYSELRQRLVRRLGSSDLADDALQDTFLRLDRTEIVGQPHNPAAYLFQAAFNIAKNRFRSERRSLAAADADALMHIADDAPDALRVIESRSDLTRLKHVMAELPRRQREILLAARVEQMSQRQIAQRFGISVSMVEKELKKAQESCVKRFRERKG